MRYKAAVIGCGKIGFLFDKDPNKKYISTHIGAYRSLNNIDVVAVCDVDEKKLKMCKREIKNINVYTDFREMLAKEKIDILSICTPPKTHFFILKEAIKYPIKGIYCEKPLAEKLEDGEKMVKLCKEKGIILQINHQRRFDPQHLEIKNYIQEKKAGEVQAGVFYYTRGIKNTGSHMFDLLRFFFGDVLWIQAYYSKNKSGLGNDPNLDGFIKFKSGVTFSFHACDANKFLIFEMDCLLENARIILKNSGFTIEFYKTNSSKYFSGYRELFRNTPPFKKNKKEFMIYGVKHLIDCIEQRKESISSGIDGLEALRLINSAIASAGKDGKRIFI